MSIAGKISDWLLDGMDPFNDPLGFFEYFNSDTSDDLLGYRKVLGDRTLNFTEVIWLVQRCQSILLRMRAPWGALAHELTKRSNQCRSIEGREVLSLAGIRIRNKVTGLLLGEQEVSNFLIGFREKIILGKREDDYSYVVGIPRLNPSLFLP